MTTLADDIGALGPWFYDFELPGGVRTHEALTEDLRSIHRDRSAMLADALRLAFPNADPDRPIEGVAAIDVGCHEGYFSHRLLELGASGVLGVDWRAGNIRKAQAVQKALGTEGLSWAVGDAEDLRLVVGEDTRFGVALVYGLLYHCENPVRVLRQIASVTTHAIVVETQLCDDREGERLEWGRQGYTLGVEGTFAVVDESRLHPTNSETGVSPLALCPSEGAVQSVLAHCGFSRVTRVPAPHEANEQIARGKRGVFVAVRDANEGDA